MLLLDVLERVQIIWDIKNIDEPTKSSIEDYIEHGFGKIDSYLKRIVEKTEEKILVKVQLEKKGKWNFVWSLFFDFPGGDVKDIKVNIDENTPEEWLPQAVAELFEKTKSALMREIDRAHDKH